MNKIQKLMAGIEELQRMHGHCQAVASAATTLAAAAAAEKAAIALATDIADLRSQLVDAINAQPDTHSLTPHA